MSEETALTVTTETAAGKQNFLAAKIILWGTGTLLVAGAIVTGLAPDGWPLQRTTFGIESCTL